MLASLNIRKYFYSKSNLTRKNLKKTSATFGTQFAIKIKNSTRNKLQNEKENHQNISQLARNYIEIAKAQDD